jgi:hypothetical protein
MKGRGDAFSPGEAGFSISGTKRSTAHAARCPATELIRRPGHDKGAAEPERSAVTTVFRNVVPGRRHECIDRNRPYLRQGHINNTINYY